MGRLYDIIQAHIDAQPYKVSINQVATALGVSRQTVSNWQTPTKLIDREHMDAIVRVTGTPYSEVLAAILDDIGYLPGAEVKGSRSTENEAG